MANRQRFPALGYRDFRLFWYGQFVSLIGTWMQTTVQPYLAYKLTDQPFYLGLIGFANALPAFILILPGGVIIERLNKRKTVIILQFVMMLQAFTMAYLALSGKIQYWHILVLTMVLGTANALEITARQAMLSELVDREALPNAIALNSTIFNAARVIGPSLSAPFLILIQNGGEGWAFFANAVSFIFVIIGLFLIRSQSRPGIDRSQPISRKDFAESLSFIRSTPLVAALVITVTIPSFFAFPFTQQIPVFARDVLGTVSDTAASVATRNSLMVTSQGIGALVAALFLAAFSYIRRKTLVMTIGQYTFTIALIGLGFARTTVFAYPLMALAGFGMVTQLALYNTLIQLSTPNGLRGRVLSTYLWAMNGTAPFGSLFVGWVTQRFGAPAAVILGGGICLLGYTILHITRPHLHQST